MVNRFYMLKDPNIGAMLAGWTPLTEANLVDATSVTYSKARAQVSTSRCPTLVKRS
ncbi:hypothetical protein ACU4HD_46530 [Cupriavidus basilensis]